jgi:hypothetical protein
MGRCRLPCSDLRGRDQEDHTLVAVGQESPGEYLSSVVDVEGLGEGTDEGLIRVFRSNTEPPSHSIAVRVVGSWQILESPTTCPRFLRSTAWLHVLPGNGGRSVMWPFFQRNPR